MRVFGSGYGMTAMWTESRVIVSALRQLMAADTPALPIHDALLVQASAVETATRAMQQAFQDITGSEAVIKKTE